jgi:2-C-methyl-D-erythritol 2,4-cyclodiphosphate synthase
MRQALAESLQISPDQIHIKATTSEGLGFCGRQEGIAAHAVALINR